jgi:hypothetical protein
LAGIGGFRFSRSAGYEGRNRFSRLAGAQVNRNASGNPQVRGSGKRSLPFATAGIHKMERAGTQLR